MRIIQAMNALPGALMVVDVGGVVRWASHGTSEVLGRDPVDLVGRSISILAPEEDLEQQAQLLDDICSRGVPTTFSTRRVRGNGDIVEVSVSMAPLRSTSGKMLGTWASVRLTDRHVQLESQLVELENLNVTLNRRSTDVSLMAKADTEITYISPSVRDVFGYDPDEIVGTKGLLLVHEDDLSGVTAFVGRVLERPDAVERLTFRIADARGEWVWIEQTLTNCANIPGVGGLVANLRDVTSEVEARAALTASERRYRTIVETAQEGVLVFEPDTTLLFLNRKAEEILGRTQDEALGQQLTRYFDPATAAGLRTKSESRARRGHERYEVTYPHPDGHHRIFEVSASPIALNDFGVTGSLAMVSDITETRRVEDALLHNTLHDSLTGLPNRALFNDRLTMALRRLAQDPDRASVAVLSIDLDGFKLVNSVHGHDVGDAVLVEVASRLRAGAYAADTVARPGSDEFIVITEGGDLEAALVLAERLRALLLEPVVVDTVVVHVDASVGVALAPLHDPSSLARSAGVALSQAKVQGRGRVHVYDPSSAVDVERRIELARGLRAAIAGNDVTLGYQPIVDLSVGTVVAVEALLRWHHPVLGLVPPPEVIATAHETGLAERLDRAILRRACADMARLRVHGAAVPIGVSVNLSASSFDTHLTTTVGEACDLTGWSPSQISLEITESSLMSAEAAAAVVLGQLRDLGVSVAIDDFGTGYSSLAYLQRLPVSTLKIDRSFVEHVPGDPESSAIARSITDLARALGLTTVAEGIETREQADFMHQIGCTQGQGYLWSPAVSPCELETLLQCWDPQSRD